MRKIANCVIAVGIAASLAWSQQKANIPAGPLKIEIVDGDAGANVLKNKTAVRPVVEVRDTWNLPVAGALVTFELPQGRPGAAFHGGKKSFQAVTDPTGRAAAAELTPLGKGTFRIAVRASYEGVTGVATLTQTNFATVADANHGANLPSTAMSISGGTKAALWAALAGGAALGAVAAVQKKKTTSAPDCTSLLNQFESDNSTSLTLPVGSTQWIAAVQNEFNALGQYCSCAGGMGALASESSVISQLETAGQQASFQVPTSCGL